MKKIINRTITALIINLSVFFICGALTVLYAIDPWPGGARENITQANMGSNLSGAVWNSDTDKLWLVSNSGYVWRISYNGSWVVEGYWDVDTASLRGLYSDEHDTEAITQGVWTGVDSDVVFLGVEQINDGTADRNYRLIKELDFSSGSPVLNNTWDVTQMRIGANNSGLEALTFVPDAWLSSLNFTDQNGNLYTSSSFGTGGLFFAGLQGNAHIYVFDLDRTTPGNYIFVGEFTTGESEIAGLEFDRSTGVLFSYHNYGYYGGGSDDHLQALSITTSGTGTKAFPVLKSWYGPRIANNEGIAIESIDEGVAGQRNFFLTTDDGGTDSLGLYKEFPCDIFGNQPPTADAGVDQSREDIDLNGSESVTLDGSGSIDPDGTIQSYVWREGLTEIATGINPTVTCAAGVHTITLTVTDNDGATDDDEVVVTITQNVNTPPETPADFTGTVLGTDSIQWQWDDANNEDGYRIYNAHNDELLYEIAEAGLTSWTQTDLESNTLYRCYVKAYNEHGESSASLVGEKYTFAYPPTDLEITNIQFNDVEVIWQDYGATRNEVQYSLQSDFSDEVISVLVEGESVLIEGLLSGRIYWFRVRGYNEDDITTVWNGHESARTLNLEEIFALTINTRDTRVEKTGIIHLTGKTINDAVLDNVDLIDQNNTILDIEFSDDISISSEGNISGDIVVQDVIQKYPLVETIKIVLCVRKENQTAEAETGVITVLAAEFSSSCYNNIFNPIDGKQSLITVEIKSREHVKIALYDSKGREIITLVNEELSSGSYVFPWDGKDDSRNTVGSGIYFVHIKMGNYTENKKIVIIK
ncbi:MAG: fibronectin type III domain-containing protein [bacterium]